VERYQKLITTFISLRKTLLLLGITLGSVTLLLYILSPQIFAFMQHHLEQKLAFYSVAEPFLAHVKLAFFSALFLLMPLILHVLWGALAMPFGLTAASRFIFTVSTIGLFYAGSLFCYFVTLPFGVRFLLSFGSRTLHPLISIDKFVSFIAIFILAFGVIFELPVFMVFCSMAGICPRGTFEKNRRYALLIISIAAALLTPTPDVVNMMLMGGPLYLLYETGILAIKIMGYK